MSHIDAGEFYLFFNRKILDANRRWSAVKKADYGQQQRSELFFPDKKSAIDFAKSNSKKFTNRSQKAS